MALLRPNLVGNNDLPPTSIEQFMLSKSPWSIP
jgi:hypothetical protein